MKRVEIRNLKKVREKILSGGSDTAVVPIESDEATLIKLLNAASYTKDDIIQCAKTLLPKYGHDFVLQFKLVEKIQDFEEVFENLDIQPGKPLFVIFAKKENHWVLFCIVKINGKNHVLYKDPCGALVSLQLQKQLERIGEVDFVAQTKQDQDAEDESSYGPLTVRNLKIALDFYQKDPNNFVRKFSEIEFAHLTDVRSNKNFLVTKLTTELSKNVEFKIAFKRFIDDLPLDLNVEMVEYRKVLDEERQKKEVDGERIAVAKTKYLGKIEEFKTKIKEHEEHYKAHIKSSKNEEYELEIQKKFPDEMKKVASIFLFFDSLKVDEEFYETLQNICSILEIDYKRMLILYKLKNQKKDTVQQKKVNLNVENIDEIVKNLPAERKSKKEDYTPVAQLLREISLGMDGDEYPKEETDSLERKYRLVKEKYEKWKNAEIKNINSWAKEQRNHLENSDDVICEAIAIMDRAFNLLTTYRLRHPQILSVLIFLDNNHNNQGRLCQIQTGEGKTLIIALLAVIRVLQGQKVDVITSNEVLANDGVAENKKFYSVFDITVATNNKSENKICYKADVLYGTISNFQFDYLRDAIDSLNIRRGRKFGLVILDEVDSMLVDNGGHIAKLATPYPGMDILRYIYIKIWQELQIAEEDLVKDLQEKIEEIIEKNPDGTENVKKHLQEVVESGKKIIKEKIKANNLTDVPLIPNHLKDYVKRKVNVWIRNAIYAKYSCHEHQQYRIIQDEGEEEIITPVDYLNTGVTMRNTIWSNGLHQFVQLKHNLRVSFESLTSSFISNIGYIKKYEDKNIFGMTGTLGSRAEQELLANIYQVTYAKVPTYKPKNFQEVSGLVVEDDKWASLLVLQVLEKLDEKRAVLVICETEQDLLEIKTNLEIFKDVRIRTYANEDDAKQTKGKVEIGDAILATNIAGRGTNFKTEKDLEKNGGLHVIVGFLPYNLRVEGQAYGRTSRQGNRGTAQLIIRQSEVEELEITEKNPDFVRIKRERDRLEENRLKQIDEVLVKEINFKDELFEKFAVFQRKWKKKHDETEYRFVLEDLREFWAFWLDKKDFKASNIKKTASEEFDSFLKEAETIISGQVAHNPFYCVALAEHYLEDDEVDKAFAKLERAIHLNGNKTMAGAHMKFFEAAIINGKQVLEKLKKYLGDLFLLPGKPSKEYKNTAIKHLQYAKDAIRAETEYIEKFLLNENSDFQKILIPRKTNFFLKHIRSRYFLLLIHEGHIDDLLQTIRSVSGVSMDGKAQTTLGNIEKISNNNKVLTEFDLNELHLIGIEALYSLKEIQDVPEYVVKAAQGQIIGGIAAISMGIIFPPILPIMTPVGITLISEGIMDIVTSLLTLKSETDPKEFVIDKFVSYAVDILSFGIATIAHCIKVLTLALKFCRKLSSFLRSSKFLKTLCQKVASKIDDFGKVLEKTIIKTSFNKMKKLDQIKELKKLQETEDLVKFRYLGGAEKLKKLQSLKKISRYEFLGDVCTKLLFKLQNSLRHKLIEKIIVEPLLDAAFEKLAQLMKESFKTSIKNNNNLCEKIRTTPLDKITGVVDDFLKTDDVKNVSETMGSKLFEKLKITYVDLLVFIYKLSNNISDFVDVYKHSVNYLDSHLQGGDSDNDLEETLETICSKIVKHLLSLIYDTIKSSSSLVKNSFTRHILPKIKQNNDSADDPPDSSGITTENADLTLAIYQPKPSIRKCYEILGLPLTASQSDARKQYRIMLMQLQPDRNLNDPETNDKFFEVKNAYEKIRHDMEERKQKKVEN